MSAGMMSVEIQPIPAGIRLPGILRHGEDGSAAQPAGDDPSTTGGDTANGAEADNPYVNSDGQLIDPTTGEVITEDSDGYDVPVSGILENGAAGDSGGDTQIPWSNGRKEVTAQ